MNPPPEIDDVIVDALWRYPVKSMRGERLRIAEISIDGIRGDRLVHVQSRRGLVTARTKPELLGLSATFEEDDVTHVEGRPWWHPEVARLVRRAAGEDASLMPSAGEVRFDVLPLLVATDGAIDALGEDGRRLRPNIVLGGVDGLAERTWEGRVLRIGDVLILLHSLRARCVMTTFHPDSLTQDVGVLRDIRRRFEGTLALNAAVLRPGSITVGDRAAVLKLDDEHLALLIDEGVLPALPPA